MIERWNPKNEIHPEIDKIPLKPNKCMKKAQGSQYWQNAHNSAAQNDEYLEIDYENYRDRLTEL